MPLLHYHSCVLFLMGVVGLSSQTTSKFIFESSLLNCVPQSWSFSSPVVLLVAWLPVLADWDCKLSINPTQKPLQKCYMK